MLLTLRTTHVPATDLGYLLHKSPQRAQSFPLTFGRAHVFYPEATETACTAALVLEVDPVGLEPGSRRAPDAAGAPLWALRIERMRRRTVAIAEVFGSALSGRSREPPSGP